MKHYLAVFAAGTLLVDVLLGLWLCLAVWSLKFILRYWE
jgi:hypothetical protein